MRKGKIFILSGPSGSGKTTLYNKLLAASKSLVKSISVTTRKKRPGEVHKRDYVFVSRKMFEFKRRAGHFIEAMKVFDNFYGTPAKGVREAVRQGKNILLCIDVQGAKVIRQKFPEAITIFIKTPSVAILRKRLTERGSEDKKVMNMRLNNAKEELKEAPKYKYVVVNDRLDHAFVQLKKIVDQELSTKT